MDLDPLLRFWTAQDDLFDRVDLHPWGAVVSDPRYPAIQEPNYARVETRTPVPLAEVTTSLAAALERTRVEREHVVVFHPDAQTDLIVAASTRGDPIAWDAVLEIRRATSPRAADVDEVEELDDAFWRAYRASLASFDVTREDVVEQLAAMEAEVFVPGGRRWFAARDRDGIAALAGLLVLDGVGYLDHVVTFPRARRRGHATALTRRAVAEARAAGAERTYLLAEPDGAAEVLYRRVGFRRVTRIASWLRRADQPVG